MPWREHYKRDYGAHEAVIRHWRQELTSQFYSHSIILMSGGLSSDLHIFSGSLIYGRFRASTDILVCFDFWGMNRNWNIKRTFNWPFRRISPEDNITTKLRHSFRVKVPPYCSTLFYTIVRTLLEYSLLKEGGRTLSNMRSMSCLAF